MKNGKKTENKSGSPMISYPIPNNVGKLQIHYYDVYNIGNFGMFGLKFFDQAGNLLLEVGEDSFFKEIVLSADERIVGVVGRTHPSYPNYY